MRKISEILNNNQLKIFAVIAMTCDHVGRQIFPNITFLQIFGRLAFPIFAYMIAEGCRYTKNRRRYLQSMALFALGCQVFYYMAEKSLYQCILVTFTLSIALIYIIDNAIKKKSKSAYVVCLVGFCAVVFVSEILPKVIANTDFTIDYGLWGIMLPVLVFAVENKWQKIMVTAVTLTFLSYSCGGMQWYSLLAIIPLALYNGERGKLRMKSFFYIYYPLHMAVIYLLSVICK